MNSLHINFILALFLILGCGSDKNPNKIKESSTQNNNIKPIIDDQSVENKKELGYNLLNQDNNKTTAKPIYMDKNKAKIVLVKPNEGNIVSNTFTSSFESVNSMNLLALGASFDMDIKRNGQRSVKLDQTEAKISIYNIPVDEGSWYIISGYMYTNSLPSDIIRLYMGYTNNKGHVFSVSYPVISISKENRWEEFIVPLYIQKDKNITDIKIIIRNVGKPDTAIATIGDIWIDDLSVYKVKDSTELFGFTKPVEKQAFKGSKTRIDKLGNMEIKVVGKFEPYFPLIIHPSGNFNDWERYKTQGFNTIICNNPAEARVAVDLGLNWVWDLHGYDIDENIANGYDRFAAEFNNIKQNNPKLLEKLLYYYWDNEKYLVFDSLIKFSHMIQTKDVDENGVRNRPLYMHLDFTAAGKNYYNDKFKLIDMQGAYANPLLYKEDDLINYNYSFKDYYNAEFANFSMFENVPNSKIPKTIFVVNSPQDVHLENTIFAALARGGRGFGFWKDGGSQADIQTRPWWNSFPDIVVKINKLKSLLRTPHWTNWDLEYTLRDDEDGLVVGKRDHDSKRCMIFASRSTKSEIVTFTTADKNISRVYDFFDNSTIAHGNGKSVILKFSSKQSGVYCWD